MEEGVGLSSTKQGKQGMMITRQHNTYCRVRVGGIYHIISYYIYIMDIHLGMSSTLITVCQCLNSQVCVCQCFLLLQLSSLSVPTLCISTCPQTFPGPTHSFPNFINSLFLHYFTLFAISYHILTWIIFFVLQFIGLICYQAQREIFFLQ